jgi:hypothetical protein
MLMSALDPKGRHGIEISEVKLMNFGDQRSGAVFLRVNVANGHPGGCDVPLVLDMETREIRKVRWRSGLLCEVDLASSRLSAMKTF